MRVDCVAVQEYTLRAYNLSSLCMWVLGRLRIRTGFCESYLPLCAVPSGVCAFFVFDSACGWVLEGHRWTTVVSQPPPPLLGLGFGGSVVQICEINRSLEAFESMAVWQRGARPRRSRKGSLEQTFGLG